MIDPLNGSLWYRFWDKVEITNTCWLWVGAKGDHGYGAIGVNGARSSKGRKNCYVHRLSYEWFVGPIPKDLVIDHLCETRNCVCPEHLEPVTRIENMRRGMLGRDKKGKFCSKEDLEE